jgi:cytochrome c553
MQAAHEIPAALRAKMPLGFRQQGMATHQAFDQMAMDAESLSDPKHSLTQTGSLLGSCVACHGQFRLESATGYKK